MEAGVPKPARSSPSHHSTLSPLQHHMATLGRPLIGRFWIRGLLKRSKENHIEQNHEESTSFISYAILLRTPMGAVGSDEDRVFGQTWG